MELFQTRLKDLRTMRNLSQKQLAEMLSTTNSSVCDWERGRTEPDSAFLLKLASVFNVSTDYLLGRTDELGAVVAPGHAAPQLTEGEKELVDAFRGLSDAHREDILVYARALSRADAQRNLQKKA